PTSLTSTLSLHDALPICVLGPHRHPQRAAPSIGAGGICRVLRPRTPPSHAGTADAGESIPNGNRPDPFTAGVERAAPCLRARRLDRKSTRLNSSHVSISY